MGSHYCVDKNKIIFFKKENCKINKGNGKAKQNVQKMNDPMKDARTMTLVKDCTVAHLNAEWTEG